MMSVVDGVEVFGSSIESAEEAGDVADMVRAMYSRRLRVVLVEAKLSEPGEYRGGLSPLKSK